VRVLPGRLQTSCVNVGFWNDANLDTAGCQAEAFRVPLADRTLVTVPGVDPATADEGLLASLLTLSDVYGTGWHAAHRAGVTAGDTVAVIGDGAVGLLAVLSANQLGAERIILMGRHEARTNLGREYGATDVVANAARTASTPSWNSPRAAPAKSWRPSATCPPTSKQSASSAPAG